MKEKLYKLPDMPDVMFELLNEVRDIKPMLWNDLAERTITALREQNSDRYVIIGSTRRNHCAALEELRLCDDDTREILSENSEECFRARNKDIYKPYCVY